jgi:hypothetical protein
MFKISNTLFLCSYFLLTSCVTDPSRQENSTSKYQFPNFTVGESFKFKGQPTLTVTEVKDTEIDWLSSTGVKSQTSKNPMLPILGWESKNSIGDGQFDTDDKVIWDAIFDGSIRFNYVQTVTALKDKSVNIYRQNWQCMFDGRKKIKIKIGEFETQIVKCYRFYKGHLKQTSTFFYAPAIQYYIKKTDEYSYKPSRTIELQAHEFSTQSLPQSELSTLTKTVQETLNSSASKVESNWTSNSKNLTAKIIADPTYNNKNGIQCRNYRGIFEIENKRMTNARTACLNSNGVWINP